MPNFYGLQTQMKSICNGDMALESLEQAEDEWERMSSKEQDELTAEMYRIADKLPEELNSGLAFIDNKAYRIFNGSEVNGCWMKGDYHYDSDHKFVQVPDFWHLEDLRQGGIIFRPL